MIVITSFAKINVQEGTRISYTYSEIDENGNMTKEDAKGSYIVFDGTETVEHLKAIETEIKGRIEQE